MLEIPFNAGPIEHVVETPMLIFQSNENNHFGRKHYVFNPEIGEGDWQPFKVDDGFEISLLKGTIKKHITFKKLAYTPEGFFDLIFCDAPTFEQVDNKNHIEVFGSNANKSAIFSNAKMDVS